MNSFNKLDINCKGITKGLAVLKKRIIKHKEKKFCQYYPDDCILKCLFPRFLKETEMYSFGKQQILRLF